MKNLFNFYEVVKVIDNSDSKLESIFGLEGTILGMSQDEESGQWGYAVSISPINETWDIEEQFLERTGKTRKRSDFYSGETIRVKVDPKTGEGYIATILFEEAKRNAEEQLAKIRAESFVSIVFNHEITKEIESGYVFFYNTPESWETRDPSYTLDGNEPIFVSKTDGQVKEITMEQFLAYENGDKSAIS